jgi:hypothetical protein
MVATSNGRPIAKANTSSGIDKPMVWDLFKLFFQSPEFART